MGASKRCPRRVRIQTFGGPCKARATTLASCKIYDVEDGGVWSYESYIFTHDKVEDLYDRINQMSANGNPPVGLINYFVFFRNPAVDSENVSPSIQTHFLHSSC